MMLGADDRALEPQDGALSPLGASREIRDGPALCLPKTRFGRIGGASR